MAIALKETRLVRGMEAACERPDGTRVPFIAFPTPLHAASWSAASTRWSTSPSANARRSSRRCWCAETLLGLSLLPQQLELWQICLRAFVVYLTMIVFVRFGKKRFLGRATAFDAILVIVIGSAAARAITGNAPFFATLAAVFVLIGLRWAIFSSPAIHRSLARW